MIACRHETIHDETGRGAIDILVRNEMAYVIFRGLNGRRQEADFGDEPIDVKIHANEDVVEICIELTGDRWHFGKKPFINSARPWRLTRRTPGGDYDRRWREQPMSYGPALWRGRYSARNGSRS
jgi:hypothetical protein